MSRQLSVYMFMVNENLSNIFMNFVWKNQPPIHQTECRLRVAFLSHILLQIVNCFHLYAHFQWIVDSGRTYRYVAWAPSFNSFENMTLWGYAWSNTSLEQILTVTQTSTQLLVDGLCLKGKTLPWSMNGKHDSMFLFVIYLSETLLLDY